MTAKEPFEDVRTRHRALLDRHDGLPDLIEQLRSKVTPRSATDPKGGEREFDGCGWFYRASKRFHEAIVVYEALYDHQLLYQQETSDRAHKGMPLVWLSDCNVVLGNRVIAKRYLMMAAIEDAIRGRGVIDPSVTGSYFRLVWIGGLSHEQLIGYAQHAWQLYEKNQELGRFPDWILQELDTSWQTEYPDAQETSMYRITRRYASLLSSRLGDNSGKFLEQLAHYLVSCIPGCRAYKRLQTHSTEYDVVGTFEGPMQDFRSGIARYFVCECKDWSTPADFSAFAKLCRVLDATKASFGILFSKNGITGERRTTDAALEQIKVFQDRGIVIVVISASDLDRIAQGENLVAMLRSKYEGVRLGLRSKP